MSYLSSRLVTPVAAIGQGLLAAYVWRFGNPGPIPMHFGLDGTVDRYGDRTEAVMLIAGMMVLSLIVGLMIDAVPVCQRRVRRGGEGWPLLRDLALLCPVWSRP